MSEQGSKTAEIALYVSVWVLAGFVALLFYEIGERFTALMYFGGLVTGWVMHVVVSRAIQKGREAPCQSK